MTKIAVPYKKTKIFGPKIWTIFGRWVRKNDFWAKFIFWMVFLLIHVIKKWFLSWNSIFLNTHTQTQQQQQSKKGYIINKCLRSKHSFILLPECAHALVNHISQILIFLWTVRYCGAASWTDCVLALWSGEGVRFDALGVIIIQLLTYHESNASLWVYPH